MDEVFYRRLTEDRVLPIIRTDDAKDAVALGKRLGRIGFGLLEVSWTTPDAARVVRELGQLHDGVGAGTILTVAMAEEALMAGARYLVAPNFSPAVSEYARRQEVIYLPGVFTPSEAATAMAAGWSWLKVFPGRTAGPHHLKALQEVYPAVRLVPTGGIDFHGGQEWLRAGAQAIGVGGALRRLSDEELYEGLLRLRQWEKA